MRYETYKPQPYKEAQVRQDFIDHFFRELGGDVGNTKGYAEAHREVYPKIALR
jgi:hypothetical protein